MVAEAEPGVEPGVAALASVFTVWGGEDALGAVASDGSLERA